MTYTPDTLRALKVRVRQVANGGGSPSYLEDDLDDYADAWETQNDNNEKEADALRQRLEAAEKAIFRLVKQTQYHPDKGGICLIIGFEQMAELTALAGEEKP